MLKKHGVTTAAVLAAILTVTLLLPGCFYQQRIRHLQSDVCLIKENTGKNEVYSLFGPPAHSVRTESGEETWVYYDVKKSFLRKLPLVGTVLGYEKYHVVTVAFLADSVRTCEYRFLSKDEFLQKLGTYGMDLINE
ncbi:MAG: hypothetical protein KKE17_06865 [Proteobacteria bacterium]|nr:hypothetical protein [Pseudomonadota bacterium]MBU1709709.1 hypothetical protein [Pseudomonadota bacterium]